MSFENGLREARAFLKDKAGRDIGAAFHHSLENHVDPCDCPPDIQRRWRGQRRLARLRRLWVFPRLWSRFLDWLEWQLGR